MGTLAEVRKKQGEGWYQADVELSEEEKEDMFEAIFKNPVSKQRHKTQTPKSPAEDKRRKKGPLDYLNYED